MVNSDDGNKESVRPSLIEELRNQLSTNEMRRLLIGFVTNQCYSYNIDNRFVEDIVQQTLEKAFRGLNEFDNKSELTTWVFSIARHIIIDHARHDNVVEKYKHKLGGILPNNQNGVERIYSSDEARIILDKIYELQDMYRDVLLLVINGLSNKEIADHLNQPLTTIVNRRNRAIKKLFNILPRDIIDRLSPSVREKFLEELPE